MESELAAALNRGTKEQLVGKLQKNAKVMAATNQLDADSGRGRTSSSSASNCSEEAQFNGGGSVSDGCNLNKNLNHNLTLSQDEDEIDHLQVDDNDDDDDGEDVFEDACDDFNRTINQQVVLEGERANLKVRLEETALILRMALSNEFVKALEICGQRAEHELYAALAHATLSFLRAALTMEPADLQAALASIARSAEVSGACRRKSSTASLMFRLLYRPNYNSYTDEQIHAELVHAESLLLLALISFLSDQSIICLVRGALKIRACYQRYKECLHIMEQRTEWRSELAQRHFESGVRMGHGIFNLLMSYLPRRVLRFLEYVGFSGNRLVGVEELERSVELGDGLRSVFSALVILTYHSYVENLFGLGHYDYEKVSQLNHTFLGHFPNSAFFLLFLGRYHQMQGSLSEAIDSFQRCIEAQNDWKQFHSICHWEMMWCYAVQMDWRKAAHYADLLRRQSKWSPASYTYQYATFLYAQLVEEERSGACARNSTEWLQRMEEIVKLMRKVPDLRTRYAGKTIPAEKFAIMRSMKFCQQSNRLTLPALEFLYIWNIFCTLRNTPQQVHRLLRRIDSEIKFIEAKLLEEEEKEEEEEEEEKEQKEEEDGHQGHKSADEEGSEERVIRDYWNDDLSLMLLLRGMCEKSVGRTEQAEASFLEVINREQLIETDTFIVPHTAMELAVLKVHLGRHDEARRWIKSTRQSYTGYLHETIVHFRLHAASRLIRVAQQELELTSSTESSTGGDAQSHTGQEPTHHTKAVNLKKQLRQKNQKMTNEEEEEEAKGRLPVVAAS